MPSPGRVAVALSGGVDSSLAASLLLEAGWEVVGLHLRMMPPELDDPAACGSSASVTAARAAAEGLGVPFHEIDATSRFEEVVLRPAWEAYAAGLTPNPCIRCNRHLKLGLLAERAAELGAVRVATGHYARVGVDEAGGPCLLAGLDPLKDQSYFLFALTLDQLSTLVLPLGGLTKARVRELARERGLVAAERPDSQDACLGTGPGGLGEALRRVLGEAGAPGAVLSDTGETLGTHGGVHAFTVGQRRGLGVALGQPAYVSEVRGASREVVITTDPEALLATEIHARGVTWLGEPLSGTVRCSVRPRYRSPLVPAVVEVSGDQLHARLERPVRAVTPGQALVLYQGERVLGGGWIA